MPVLTAADTLHSTHLATRDQEVSAHAAGCEGWMSRGGNRRSAENGGAPQAQKYLQCGGGMEQGDADTLVTESGPSGDSPSTGAPSRTSALANFEANREAERQQKDSDTAKESEDRQRAVLEKSERARVAMEEAERQRAVEAQRRKEEEEKHRAEQLKQQEANMRRFEQRKQDEERRQQEQRESDAQKKEQEAFAKMEAAKKKMLHDQETRDAEETERLRQQAVLQQEQLEKQAAAMAKFEEEQALKRMSEEDRRAFLEEKARKEAEELAAARAKARAEETKEEAPWMKKDSGATNPSSVASAGKCCVLM
ncbi:unnamed protein product [Ectocarpus fasciculatus]